MEGLSVSELQKPNKQFDYKVYSTYCKHNPEEAKRYIESFNDVESTTDVQMTAPEVKQEVKEEKTEQKIVIRQEDVVELRKIYQERHPEWKQAFRWRGAEQLVERINSLPTK